MLSTPSSFDYQQDASELFEVAFEALVLNNRKDQAVRQAPFNFAYEVFERRLSSANRWLIAGYSFGDIPVNNAIRAAYRSRERWRWSRPRVLVLDKGGTEDALVERVSTATGINEADITMNTQGLPDSAGSAAWQQWAD